jgi:hypothetical protein
MIPFAARRVRNTALLGLTALTLVLIYERSPVHDWQNASLLTGWLLVAAVLCLLLYNIRKKLPVVPLFAASGWLQFHAYLGVLAAGIFVVHTGGRFPAGALDRVLWCFFVVLALSGLTGFWLSRSLPARLRSRGEAVLFERIPAFRARLAAEVEALAANSVKESGSLVIAELYLRRIKGFLVASVPLLGQAFRSRRALANLRHELRAVERYLTPAGRETLAAIEERIIVKDGLDYQYALHFTMKGWLFIHIPIAYGILPLIGIHILLFYAFGRI